MPSCVGLVLISIGLWLIWRRMRHGSALPARSWGLWMAVLGCAELYLFSTPLVATWLAQSLEAQTQAVKIEDLPKADAIVVLAGGQAMYMLQDGTPLLFQKNASDRLERGFEALVAGKAPILCIGNGMGSIASEPDYAAWIERMGRVRGVDSGAILVGPPAKYTQDESEGLVSILRNHGASHVILATSASHMPRARAHFEHQGIEVTPLSCDFGTRGIAERFTVAQVLPRGLALAQSEDCLKEWLGTLVRLCQG
jgi:uncharacterized SAM-binding protein YcdF (DUF218 family)